MTMPLLSQWNLAKSKRFMGRLAQAIVNRANLVVADGSATAAEQAWASHVLQNIRTAEAAAMRFFPTVCGNDTVQTIGDQITDGDLIWLVGEIYPVVAEEDFAQTIL